MKKALGKGWQVSIQHRLLSKILNPFKISSPNVKGRTYSSQLVVSHSEHRRGTCQVHARVNAQAIAEGNQARSGTKAMAYHCMDVS
ncbi:hypothetical protein [Cupriavidus numazuensis]|uniref:hypothetical protein n=1 Tax=Cupriavidus numazuensis TaxID=221992 RepID=UPI001BAAC85E|nr:hypothetical protein [Cupriavidus numazuensis]